MLELPAKGLDFDFETLNLLGVGLTFRWGSSSGWHCRLSSIKTRLSIPVDLDGSFLEINRLKPLEFYRQPMALTWISPHNLLN